MSEAKANRWRKILTFVTLGALFLLVFFSRDQIGETFLNIRNINAWILLSMIVWQIFNYHSYSELYRDLFRILGNKIRYISMYKVAIELNFVNHVFPSAGVAGFSYFGLRMKQLGVPASKATLVQMMRFATVFISFQVLLLIGVVVLAIDGKANDFTILVASSIGTLLVVGTLIAMYIIDSKTRIDAFTVGLTKIINRAIQLLRPKHPETINISWVSTLFLDLHKDYQVLKKNYKELKRPLIYAFFANVTEVATVYVVFLAFGEAVNIGAVILAYAVANFAGLISVLPGGIGVYEALMAGVLATAGVPPSIGVPVTVMYRVISMAIQLPPGYYFYQKALKNIGAPNT